MSYRYAVLDPRTDARNKATADVANEAIFEDAPAGVLGIEVTVPALAARCALGNVDPQHTGGDVNTAAIEVAVSYPFPPDGTMMVTIRPDLDSVGAMAVLAIRGSKGPRELCSDCPGDNPGCNTCEGSGFVPEPGFGPDFWARLKAVAAADKFVQPPWSPEAACGERDPQLQGIGAFVWDREVQLGAKVAAMAEWLLSGIVPAGYEEKAQTTREQLAREGDGVTACQVQGGIAIVATPRMGAPAVGYRHRPVVVCEGLVQGKRKFSVCQWDGSHADLGAALAELATLEAGWGGSPTIGGSPQGVGSTLTIEQVVEVVANHLK